MQFISYEFSLNFIWYWLSILVISWIKRWDSLEVNPVSLRDRRFSEFIWMIWWISLLCIHVPYWELRKAIVYSALISLAINATVCCRTTGFLFRYLRISISSIEISLAWIYSTDVIETIFCCDRSEFCEYQIKATILFDTCFTSSLNFFTYILIYKNKMISTFCNSWQCFFSVISAERL